MSEYQYYEFQAIDRPLHAAEQAEISRLSRRVALTPRQAVFTYNYGDFPGNPIHVLAKYFDAMLYLANWGSKQLVFRFPRSLIDVKTLAPYCFPDVISTSLTKDAVLLDIRFDEEEGESWIEGEGWLSPLVPLRQDILRGDLRVLYLAWLKAVALIGESEEDEDLREPPVPADLQTLSAPLKAFVELCELDQDLLTVASAASAQHHGAGTPALETWVAALTEAERLDFLVRLARGEPHVDVQLVQRLRALAAEQPGTPAQAAPQRRTVSALLARRQSICSTSWRSRVRAEPLERDRLQPECDAVAIARLDRPIVEARNTTHADL
ncbi:MAG: hypothetical protein HYZ81_18170, partial [Nitrospinae bacterium]|nr:hypothetical protein [Nitrospinota bacterium]